MKKSILVTLGGVGLGLLLMLGVFFALNLESKDEDVLLKHPIKQEGVSQENRPNSELLGIGDIIETEVFEESEILQDTEVLQETEDLTETEIAESGTQEVPKQNTDKKPNQNAATVVKKIPYYIKVNRQANCVTVYGLDEVGNYTVPVKAMTCSVGLNNSTPLGISKISDKYVWRLLFGNTYGHYSVRFNGHILFHSVPYMKTSNDTLKEGQFNLLGQPASMGCIRLCVADAKWIYDNCAKGTVVEVYDSANPGPLGKPSMPKVDFFSPFYGWDPTDPNARNPWLYGTMSLCGVKDISVDAGTTVDLLSGVSATDVDGLSVAVTTSGEVDFYTPGSYEVTYMATGVLGDVVTAKAVVTVLPIEVVIPEVPAPKPENPSTEENTEMETPETEVPGTETPGTEPPETEVPGTETPGTENPGTEVPGTETPGTENPGTEVPGTETPGTENPGTEVPGTEIPETETPGTEVPGTEIPETETPGTEVPGTETPGTEVPGIETPEIEVPGVETSSTEAT